jgi:hyaluronoglucosaminidase
VASWGVMSLLVVACSGGGDGSADVGDGAEGSAATSSDGADHPGEPVLRDRTEPLPVITPTPQTLRWLGPDVAVPAVVDVIAGDGSDDAAHRLVVDILGAAGATDTRVLAPGERTGGDGRAGLVVRLGAVDDPAIAGELRSVGLEASANLPDEGYALAAFPRDNGPATVVVGGADPAGTFYGAQTLRQLTQGGSVRSVGVVDHPAMALRGTVEGFYGSPWTHAERLDLLDFHGRFKLNTYIYAPKDDPYHRDRWREPYPPDAVDELAELIDRATANHVRLTFAVSPGVSICFSDPADTEALVAKLRAVHGLGVRAFSIALDDIDHTRWHCDGDTERYGAPSTEAAARAQVDLLNTVKRQFVDAHDGTHPLQMVPTEYRGTDDSPYLRVLREGLDPAIEVMWTGDLVVPAEITAAQAQAAAGVYGRPTFVWDNTPVNDFPPTEGRLLLGPYDRREPGLSDHVRGIVLNPMNQAAASKVALVGGADFAWNDTAYEPERAHRAAADLLAGGDDAVVDALLAFFDLEHLAPTSSSSGTLSLPQSPVLAGRIDAFRSAWAAGDRAAALADLRLHAERLAAAPETIRRHVVDEGFIADCEPWLDATALWGRAFVTTLDALEARVGGDEARSSELLATADDLVAQAGAIETIPGATYQQGPVRVADGVLDTFLAEARHLR